jgi:hypothetical protein
MTNETDALISVGADVDVGALMADVRAEVARKRKAGLYPPEIAMEVDQTLREPGPAGGDAFRKSLSELRRASGFSANVPATSRRPVVGPFLAFTKRVIRSMLRWYMHAILEQIAAFGWKVIKALGVAGDRLDEQQERINRIEETLIRLEQRLAGLEETARGEAGHP